MSQRLRVLTYHRILDRREAAGDSLASATPAGFIRQMESVARRYRVVTLETVLAAQRGNATLPPRALLLTFDDASPDFLETAAPALKRIGLPATLFVPTAYPGSLEPFWWDRLRQAVATTERTAIVVPPLGSLRLTCPTTRHRSLKTLRDHIKTLPHHEAMRKVEAITEVLGHRPASRAATLGWPELRALAGDGISLAAHTRTHALLTRLSLAEIEAEIGGSLRDLEEMVGTAPPVLCYPAGAHDDAVVAAARKAGVELAFTCIDGHNEIPSADPLRLRRTNVTLRTSAPLLRMRLHRVGASIDRWRHRAKDDTVGGGTVESSGVSPQGEGLRVAYVMSRFPKLSETFVLNELVTLDEAGIAVELFPLLRENQPTSHPEAAAWVQRARFRPFLSAAVLSANLRELRQRPTTYLAALREALGGTLGSLNFFLAAAALFPKAVAIGREMENLGVTHLHAHFATHPALVALIVHRLTGIPFSFTAHGSDLHVDRRMLDRKLSAAAFAVAISEFNRQVMLTACGDHLRDRIHVIHCGVDPTLFRGKSLREESSAFELICVASLEEVKGHRFLLDACRILDDRGIAIRCHLIGEGPEEERIREQRARLRLESVVILHGGLPRQAVAAMLSRADGAVLASHPTRSGKREGIPVALMEAMAAELPVVASEISGIPELVEDGATGMLVPSGDPIALAHAIEKLAGDADLRRRLGRAARDRILTDFDGRASTLRLAALFTTGIGSETMPADPDYGQSARGPSPYAPRIMAVPNQADGLANPAATSGFNAG